MTVELSDELFRLVKIRAVEENRKLKDMVAELLHRGLDGAPAAPARRTRRVRLPLVRCAREAPAGEELTPDRVAEVLLRDDVVNLNP